MAKDKLVIESREQAEKTLSSYAAWENMLEGCVAERYEIKLRAAQYEAEMKKQGKALSKWAAADLKKNPGNWKGKTLLLEGGRLSFNTSPGKVDTLRKIAKSFEAALNLVRASRKKFIKKFIRPQPDELNKELILQDFEDGRVSNEELAEFGLVVKKPETFTVQTKGGGNAGKKV